jgi:hypothetical protein
LDPPAALLDFIGPDGECISQSDLPPPGFKRCCKQQKALVVAAVRHGMLTFAEACERYDLSLDDFMAWHRIFDELWPLGGGAGSRS